jgi:hypothetical protein
MRTVFSNVLLGAWLVCCVIMFGSAAAQPLSPGAHDHRNPHRPAFVLDRNNYPAVTRFVFLVPKDGDVTPAYMAKVNKFIDAVAAQPGFRASMSLLDIDRTRVTIYYHFDSQAQWENARNNPPPEILAAAGVLQSMSSRFEDVGARPLEQFANGETPPPPGQTPPPSNYVSRFYLGEGVATNEALVVAGRTQAELTTLMRRAGIVNNPNVTPGFVDFTFHQALDGSRNINLLHWATPPEMAAAAIYQLIQPLINNPGYVGTSDGWGANGVGLIGVRVYQVVRIQNGRP